MAADPDPYRTLGLPRDATTEEIRRAYRRLAKANHPDSAGEAALPRFLAIQAAYETLIGPAPDGLGRGSAGSSRAGAGPWRGGGEPWRADPDRARSTREAWERRAGRRPGARPGAAPESDAGGAGSTRRRAASSGATAGETRTRAGGASGRRGERRGPNKATPGSTTYDAAEDEPFEPEWSGGTWYGSSSGTYWTINPKEYADPRKHGPEYQRRARRRLDGSPGFEPEDLERGRFDYEPDRPGSGAGDEETHAEARRAETAGGPAAETWTAPAGSPAGPGSPPGAGPPPARAAASASASWLGSLAWPGGFAGRVALALLAWPPIGLALATAAGELTGCSRFAAGCVELFGVGTWLGQLVILAVLLALPALAAVAAVGTLAVLAASVPAAVFLSATGGSREPEAAAAILAVVLGIAWLVGAAFAVVRRVRLRRVP
jgi:curved DNA-binding protein CbpA